MDTASQQQIFFSIFAVSVWAEHTTLGAAGRKRPSVNGEDRWLISCRMWLVLLVALVSLRKGGSPPRLRLPTSTPWPLRPAGQISGWWKRTAGRGQAVAGWSHDWVCVMSPLRSIKYAQKCQPSRCHHHPMRKARKLLYFYYDFRDGETEAQNPVACLTSLHVRLQYDLWPSPHSPSPSDWFLVRVGRPTRSIRELKHIKTSDSSYFFFFFFVN